MPPQQFSNSTICLANLQQVFYFSNHLITMYHIMIHDSKVEYKLFFFFEKIFKAKLVSNKITKNAIPFKFHLVSYRVTEKFEITSLIKCGCYE